MAAWVFLAVVAIVGLWAIGIYNGLVRLRNGFKNSFSQIDVQLKRRYDLIPNLVETAKAYMKHEKETLENVIRARNTAFQAEQKAAGNPADAQAMRAFAQAEAALTSNVGRFMAVLESYPDLKANTTMNQLMEELSSTENKVSFARQAYNDSVMAYNNAREVFPSVLFAASFGFQPAQPLEIEKPEEREPVRVSFG
ncbi:MAG: LemA family protein [Bdellovibrionales bacterium]